MQIIDADRVAQTLQPGRLIDALRVGHAHSLRPQVERLLLTEQDRQDSCLIWAGWQPHQAFAVKIASVFPRNAENGSLPNVQSVVALFDGRSGRPAALIHGEAFTRMKTAADSALGVDLLAMADPVELAVLGAGGQAETHIQFLLAVRPTLRSVRIWNRTPDRAADLAKRLSYPGVVFAVAASVEEAVQRADIVTSLTACSEPIVRGEWLKAGAHVDLVGGYTPAMREVDDTAVLRARLFADSLRFSP